MTPLADEIRSLLMDVALDGAKVISKRKLLWLLGKNHDRPNAWVNLVAHWEAIGMPKNELEGTESGGSIVLIRGHKVQFDKVTAWANM